MAALNHGRTVQWMPQWKTTTHPKPIPRALPSCCGPVACAPEQHSGAQVIAAEPAKPLHAGDTSCKAVALKERPVRKVFAVTRGHEFATVGAGFREAPSTFSRRLVKPILAMCVICSSGAGASNRSCPLFKASVQRSLRHKPPAGAQTARLIIEIPTLTHSADADPQGTPMEQLLQHPSR